MFHVRDIIVETGFPDAGSRTKGGKKVAEVYYVEDDKNIADIVKEYLTPKGYEVSVFPRIGEAKRALERRVPDLVLADWNMPDGKGDAFCRWIRMRWEGLPVIFLTVRGDTCDVVLMLHVWV